MWFHRLRTAYPEHKLVLTFFSPSGYEVKKNTSAADVVVYLPMDSNSKVKRFLKLVAPELAIFVKFFPKLAGPVQTPPKKLRASKWFCRWRWGALPIWKKFAFFLGRTTWSCHWKEQSLLTQTKQCLSECCKENARASFFAKIHSFGQSALWHLNFLILNH